MQKYWVLVGLLSVASCAPPPESVGGGVGFGDRENYQAERAQREAELQAGLRPGPLISPESTAPGVVAPAQPTQVASATTAAQPDLNNPGISDEQNFEAVSSRETIESDAERLERQRQQYQVIEPTALPSRNGDRPNIVAFALATTHRVGTKVYPRGPLSTAAAAERACKRYISDDMAQEAFLASGGPDRDPKRLDPDGDGFACGWDPAPFRKIRARS